jgi:hypothetical protein
MCRSNQYLIIFIAIFAHFSTFSMERARVITTLGKDSSISTSPPTSSKKPKVNNKVNSPENSIPHNPMEVSKEIGNLCCCRQQYETREQLEEHIHEKHARIRFKCPTCVNQKFNTCELLITHMKKHKEDTPFRCTIIGCNELFATEELVKLHIEHMHQSKTYSCSCGFYSLSHDSMYEHIKSMHSIEGIDQLIFECPACKEMAASTEILLQHMNYEHAKEVTTIARQDSEHKHQCTKCPKVFHSSSKLKSHMIVHLPQVKTIGSYQLYKSS